eukprot:gnl/MRDRNA2_/MRDRNA2_195954_c0_seq1.p1 gnl/MRDRNA2_/MRDRNA2_195954_c0~~gnl/MRDRNA2_/MRDRNA2_195954_c0_seq1.p1  ORF type:complete len:301 (+),score=28.55 gnl/MRDRNA2_/MRDRNA2_195954_c0_seq1:77-979(+)
MGCTSGILSISLLTTIASAYDIELCPEFEPSENFISGMVGWCYWTPCPPKLGPTDCTDQVCYCKAGYCAYPSRYMAARSCQARIPGGTCDNSHEECFPFSDHSDATVCDQGLCMCQYGYNWNETSQKCEEGEHQEAQQWVYNYSRIYEEQLRIARRQWRALQHNKSQRTKSVEAVDMRNIYSLAARLEDNRRDVREAAMRSLTQPWKDGPMLSYKGLLQKMQAWRATRLEGGPGSENRNGSRGHGIGTQEAIDMGFKVVMLSACVPVTVAVAVVTYAKIMYCSRCDPGEADQELNESKRY